MHCFLNVLTPLLHPNVIRIAFRYVSISLLIHLLLVSFGPSIELESYLIQKGVVYKGRKMCLSHRVIKPKVNLEYRDGSKPLLFPAPSLYLIRF